jgi:hypothetical protein
LPSSHYTDPTVLPTFVETSTMYHLGLHGLAQAIG